MAIDIDSVRRAYYTHREDDHPDHVPTREELIARYERRAFALCLSAGRDPAVEHLGEHGSLVGGSGNPLRIFARIPEDAVPLEPMPLDWFSYPEATTPVETPSRPRREDRFIPAMLSAAYLAGIPDRPSGEEVARMLRDPQLTDAERFFLNQIFSAIYPAELMFLISRERLSI